MNQAQFAKLHSVSKKTVTMWKAKGWLVLLPDGSVDTKASNKLIQKYRTNVGRKRSEVKKETKSKPVSLDKDTENHEDLTDILAKIEGGNASTDEAQRFKENYLALIKRQEFEEKSKSTIQIAEAERILFDSARAQRDAWLNWPARVSPIIAAEFGVEADKMTEVLTAHVHKHIDTLGEPDAAFGKN